MPRYAIYFVPEQDTPLARFGTRAIGYDVESGVGVDFHDHAFYRQPEINSWTASPRRYGFHATLKAPFELTDGQSIAGLMTAAAAFASNHAPVELGHLRVRAIGSFVALTSASDETEVQALASACVREFDRFRGALNEADLRRRLSANLTLQQQSNVHNWGYPYVHDEFRFHMTLTGRLRGRDTVKRAVRTLSEIYSKIDQPVSIGAITVAEQADRSGQFRVLDRYLLTGSATRS